MSYAMAKYFHRKYKKVSSWWKVIRAEFELLEDYTELTPIMNYEYEDNKVYIKKNGLMTVKKGFRWGASGPTWDTKSTRRASCLHDAIFYLSDKKVFAGERSTRVMKLANTYMYELLIADGMWKWRALAWYKTLDKASWMAWEAGE